MKIKSSYWRLKSNQSRQLRPRAVLAQEKKPPVSCGPFGKHCQCESLESKNCFWLIKMQYVLHWPPFFPACKLNPEGGPSLGLQLYFKLLNVSCILFTRNVLQIFLPVCHFLQSLKLATKTTSVSCCESLYIKLFYWKLSGRKQGNPLGVFHKNSPQYNNWLLLTFRNGPKLAVWMRKSGLLECTR